MFTVGVEAKVPLAGGNGTGLAVTDKDKICFNGRGDADSHETFVINRLRDDDNFCKTARKPYDIMVCATLMIVRHYIPDFKVSSDGDKDEHEWQAAIALCQKVLHYGVYPCGDERDPEESLAMIEVDPPTDDELNGVIKVTRISIKEEPCD